MTKVKITEGWLQGCYGETGMVRGHGWEMAEDACMVLQGKGDINLFMPKHWRGKKKHLVFKTTNISFLVSRILGMFLFEVL